MIARSMILSSELSPDLPPLRAKLKIQNHRETQYMLFFCCNQQIVMMKDHGFSVEMEIYARLDSRFG